MNMRERGAMNERMADWCKRNANNPRVLEWLKRNPPPKDWRGSVLEWAYTEMPFGPR